jgi:uroporphyrinogen-III synthase
MRVLITRPKEDAKRVAERLRERGHEALCAGLLSVHHFDGPELTLEGVSAVVATSANGVRALALRTPQRDLPLFAVGPQTADAAKREGFQKIECADGDAATLATTIPSWVKPEDGVLLHAASADNEGRLKALLVEEGYAVDVQVLYEVIAEETLPEEARLALANDSIDAVIVFSPRSAQALRDSIMRAGLAAACARIAAVCISRATEQALSPLVFRTSIVAERPNQDALLRALESLQPEGPPVRRHAG